MRYPNSNTPIKWTKENILEQIREKSVNGYCKSSDVGMALTEMAKRLFGSFKTAVELSGNKRWADRPKEKHTHCTVHDCKNPVRSALAKYCELHYGRIRRNGHLDRLDGLAIPNETGKCFYCKTQLGFHKKYCNRKCFIRHGRNSLSVKPCKWCSKPFNAIDYGKGSNRVCCSDECRRLANRAGEKLLRASNKEHYAIRERTAEYKRKARKLAVAYEDIDRLKVFERDNFICMLCKGSIDINLKWPDRYSPTLDHIKPLSKGGSHTYSNVQSAHLTCNCSKGNKSNNPHEALHMI
jgi:5-methylcytosine-specific restriction endonuclease McrA